MDYWWTGRPEEDLWIEITHASDREDFLENIGGQGGNQVNQSGLALLPYLKRDDIVFHYDLDREIVVGASQVIFSDYDYEPDEDDDEDLPDGFEPSVGIGGFRLCEEPVSLEAMRQRKAEIIQLRNRLQEKSGQRDIFYPWTLQGESLQMSSSLLAKFPNDALQILPELAPVVDAVKEYSREGKVPPPQPDGPRIPWDRLTPDAVQKALAEYDELGREEFLRQYGFHHSRAYMLVQKGNEYDSKAVAGVAFKHVPEVNRPLRAEEFSGGRAAAAGRLRDLGFEVYDLRSSNADDDGPLGSDPGRYIAAVEQLPESLDVQTVSTSRREQTLLRGALGLFSGHSHECALCGRELPNRFLRAAHIKPRALCTEEERRNVRAIVMAACVFGCDALFEERWIAVDRQGRVAVSSQAKAVAHLRDLLRQLDGRPCSAWNRDTKPYFAWHFARSAVQ